MTDEIRVTIAGQAAILLLHRGDDYYTKLRSILVYPHAYVAKSVRPGPGGTVEEGFDARLGESWTQGAVILSWDDVKRSASDVHDGHNVVLHEFAHQLDQEDGQADGEPVLPSRSSYLAWARVLGGEYRELVREVENYRRTDIDPYGAVSPAEFFAVVTEYFFQQPGRLRKKHPRLYEQLRLFYRQDPANPPGPPANS
jgi:Mlc titration factor MtfA (ptsG expression regulator)